MHQFVKVSFALRLKKNSHQINQQQKVKWSRSDKIKTSENM